MHDLLRHKRALTEHTQPGRNRFPVGLSSLEKKNSHLLLNKHGDLSFFQIILPNHSSSFCQSFRKKNTLNKLITRNASLMEINSLPREHAGEEGFKSILADATSICHKTSVKLFLVIDVLNLYCFKVCFSYVLPVPTLSGLNR